MYRLVQNFKKFIQFIVTIFACREFGFIYCVIGTLAQAAHTYYLIDEVSSLTGWLKILQAFGLSIFISSSLLFFTAIADNEDDTDDGIKIRKAVNLFMIIEIVINFYYYAAHLIINTNGEGNNWLTFEYRNIFNFIFAVIISCLIPITIKLYAGIIRAKEWLNTLENDTQTFEIPKNNENNSRIKIENQKALESKNLFSTEQEDLFQTLPTKSF